MSHSAVYWFTLAVIAVLLYLVIIGYLSNRTKILQNVVRKLIKRFPRQARVIILDAHEFGWLNASQRDSFLKEYSVK
jgi:hypothetical protein